MPEIDLKEREIGTADKEAIQAVIEELETKRNTIPKPSVTFDQEQSLSSTAIKITAMTLDPVDSPIEEMSLPEDSAIQIRELMQHKKVARLTGNQQATKDFHRIGY